jgi:hypothetical protein
VILQAVAEVALCPCLCVYAQAPDSPYTVEKAMRLFPGMDQFDLIWEKVTDTKMLMAWGPGTVVLAFRGTASFTNVVTDIQVEMRTLLMAAK